MVATPEEGTSVYLLLSKGFKCVELAAKTLREVDGVAVNLLPDVGGAVKEAASCVSGKSFKLILVEEDFKVDEINWVGEAVESFSDPIIVVRDVARVKEVEGVLKGTSLGVKISNPFPNFTQLKREGVKAALMPHSLIKGRVSREAKAAGIKLYAYLVNDAATLKKMMDAGVAGVVTEKPGIVKEVSKLGL